MLDAMRKSAGGTIAKIFIALLVLSFGIWGIADVFRDFGQNTVAEVGSAEITAVDFQRAYNREVQNLSQRIGQPLSGTQAAALGVPGQVLGRAVAEATFDHIAKEFNLGISNDALVTEIHADPMFRGPDGRFDRSRLQQLLYANGYSEDEYIRTRMSTARRRQIAEGLAGGATVPQTMLEAMHQYRSEERTVRYLTLDASAVEPTGEPDATTLEAYFNDNKATYRAPEYRKLEMIVVDPASLAKPQNVSEEDARQTYESSLARFGSPERRQVLQLTFADKEKADAAAAKLAAGTAFEDLVTEQGLTLSDVDLGLMTRDKLIDPAIAEAAFSLDEGAVSDVIEGRFAPVIVKITKIEPEAVKSYDEVKDILKDELATRRAEGEVLDLYDEIEDARAGGATLTELGERFKLDVRTVDAVDSSGKDMAGNTIELPEANKLLSEAFSADIGYETAPVQIGQRGFTWFDVKDVIADRDRTLDEVRGRVIDDWKAAQLQEKLTAKAEEIATRLKDGAAMDAIATELGLEAKISDPVTRETSTADLSVAAVSQAFEGPVGHVATAATASGGQMVLQVASVDTPPFFAPDGDEMKQVMQRTLIDQYLTGVQESIGVQINQAAIARAIGTDGRAGTL
ncbi:peptidylprolyl isomerase [Breoghania sp. L-A4]|uniref:peptidylprolyl isomerase n=1 Tax=Breoghania sp. L-A4 TaxID=2304600 RepID=UPI000E35F85C|nr:peptidylprolyl isomerase [Breoghania sp. L-A4]AXS40429.1 peptidylprolyl isomerase [Breoghania sp. L-A4]